MTALEIQTIINKIDGEVKSIKARQKYLSQTGVNSNSKLMEYNNLHRRLGYLKDRVSFATELRMLLEYKNKTSTPELPTPGTCCFNCEHGCWVCCPDDTSY